MTSQADPSGVEIIANGTVVAGPVPVLVGSFGMPVGRGQAEEVYAGGTAVDAFIIGGRMDVFAGGLDSGAYLDMGVIAVQSGGTADGASVDTLGTIDVAAGGVARNLGEDRGGTLAIAGTADGVDMFLGYLNIAAGGIVTGATMMEANATIAAGGTLDGAGLESASITDGGVLARATGEFGYIAVLAGGTLEAGILDKGTITLAAGAVGSATTLSSGELEVVAAGATLVDGVVAGGTLDLSAAGAVATGSIAFAGTGGLLELSAANPVAIPIAGFAPGDAISLAGLSPDGAMLTVSGDDVTVSDGTATVTLDIAGAASDMLALADVGGLVVIEAAACFTAGTRLDTPLGPRPVEDLRAGDTVDTQAGPAAIVWVGHRRATDARVVRFRPHALGPGAPGRDLCVSHDHAMLVGGVLVPAHLLANGTTIVEERWPRATFHHVELAAHGILWAEGAAAESYLDTGNRAQFGNCPLFTDPVRPAAEACAEMVVAGARLAQARAAIPVPA